MSPASWVPIAIMAGVVLLRVRRASREQPLRLGRLWVVPALITGGVLLSLVALPTPPSGWLALVGGLLIGSAAGWHRGKLMRIRLDPVTGDLFQQASPAAIVLLLAIVVLRTALRDVAGASPTDHHPALLAVIVTDGLMGFAVGLLTFTRIEMYLRAKRLREGQGDLA